MEARIDPYRENHERAIYIHGEINQELVDRITPDINRLRLTASSPITLYVDCPGGDIYAADNIRELIKCPNPDGDRCQVITVVTGTAASAAADLLALGDYSIAHSHTVIIYHGTREQRRQPLTFETARSLASSLQETNEMFARRLAQRIFKRFILRLGQLQSEFLAFRQCKSEEAIDFAAKLVDALKKNITPSNHRLIRESLTKQEAINELTVGVVQSLKRHRRELSSSEIESVILTSIIKKKVRQHANDRWQLSRKGLQEVSDDFRLIHDFYYGSQNEDLHQQTGKKYEPKTNHENRSHCRSRK